MSHNPDLTAVMHRCGASAIGENVAYGQASDKEVIAAWMASTGHRKNILGTQYRSVAVAYATGTDGGRYWAQVFLG